MTLKEALQQFLTERKWDDEIQHDDDSGVDRVATLYRIDTREYTLILQAEETTQTMQILMISSLRIPKDRAPQAALVINFLNSLTECGRLAFDKDSGELNFHWTIDVEGTVPAARQFHNMINAAASAFDPASCQALAAVVFSKLSPEEIIQNFTEEISKEETDEAPSEL